MGKYRKKPVVIEAVQWDGNNREEVERLVFSGHTHRRVDFEANKSRGVLIIETLEGDMEAQPGDFIIQGIQGEIYPCKPDIFNETYEAVST